jgi:cell wall assembly regulator SMI1/Lon protease-like protein
MPSAASLVPNFDGTVHVVLDDSGKLGRAYVSFASVVSDLLTGRFNNPLRVVAFNSAEGWSRDVSEDVAREVVKQVAERGLFLAAGSRRFVARYVDEGRKEPTGVSGETSVYPVVPLRDIIVFPHMTVPLFIGREKSIRALEQATKADRHVLLVMQTNAADDDPSTDALFTTGTLAIIQQYLKLPDGTVKADLEGVARARLNAYTRVDGFFEAVAEPISDDAGGQAETAALARSTASQFEIYVKLVNKRVMPDVVAAVGQLDDPDRLADTVASYLAVGLPEKQRILEMSSVRGRLETCLSVMERGIMALPVEKRQPRTPSLAQVRQDRREQDFVAATTTDIEATWKRIVDWLEKNAPRAASSLQRGASEAELREFEAAIGQRMPADWRALYRLANGQAYGEPRIWFGLDFMNLESSLSEWRSWSAIIASHDEEDLRTEFMGSYPNGAVRLTHACTGWIPLAADSSGNHFGVDLSPGDVGTSGQIINFGRDEDLKFVMAQSLGLFLQWMADEMEGGGVAVDDDGSPILVEPRLRHFLDAVPKRFGPEAKP